MNLHTSKAVFFLLVGIELSIIGFTTLMHIAHQPLALDLGGIQEYTEK